MDTLAVGKHTLNAETKDGNVEMEFTVKDESDADKYTPSAEKVEVDFGKAVTKDIIKSAIKGIPKDANIAMDESKLPDGKKAGSFDVKVTITYSDQSQDELHVSVVVKEENTKPNPDKPDPQKPDPQTPGETKPGQNYNGNKGGKTTVEKDNVKAKDTTKTGDNANSLGYAGLTIAALGTLYIATRRKKTM